MKKQLPATSSPEEVFQQFEKLDDEQIVAEITGKIYSDSAKAMYYTKDKRESLSKRGLDECCIALQTKGYVLREEDLSFVPCPVDKNFVVFSAKVSAFQITGKVELKMNTVIGTKRQELLERGKKDPYWFEKGSQKALRNAKKKLIPEKIKADVIHGAKQKEHSFRGQKQQAPPKKESSVDDFLDTKIGFSKTGEMTWRQAAENMTPLLDGGQARQYLNQLADWHKKDPTKKGISEKAQTALDFVENKRKAVTI